MEWKDYPVFIVGLQKSGTTLLRNLLDGAERMVVVPEEVQIFHPRFLDRLSLIMLSDGTRSSKSTDVPVKVAQLIMSQTPLSRFQLSNPTETVDGLIDYGCLDQDMFHRRLESRLAEEDAMSGRAILLSIVGALFDTVPMYQNGPTPVCWLEKTPPNYARVPYLLRWFPRARFIHLIRDPRDTWLALSRKWETATIPKVARKWLRATHFALANQRKLGAERYYILRYEDLVSDTAGVVRTLCQFSGICFGEQLLQPTKLGHAWYGNSMFGLREGAVYGRAVGRYREACNYESNRQIEAIVGLHNLSRWNYKGITDLSMIGKVEGRLKRSLFHVKDVRDFRREFVEMRSDLRWFVDNLGQRAHREVGAT